MTTVLFIHSAGSQEPGEGSSGLLSALRESLPAEFDLRAPLMPNPDSPEAEPWRTACEAEIARIEGDFVLFGHSLGGSTILQTLARSGLPPGLLGVVTLAAPFWGAPDWAYDSYALPPDAGDRLKALRRLIMLQGDKDDVVAADHPERYRQVLPKAEIRVLPGIDHEAKMAAPDVIKALRDITAA